MNDSDERRGPTAERLLDVRTPAEIAFSPDGWRVVFALHATVADLGMFVPSDLYLIEGDGQLAQLTSGMWSDRTPVWSADGARLAFLSDRITPGHQLPYTMVPGGEPVHAGTFEGSAESLASRTPQGSSRQGTPWPRCTARRSLP
jgi:Tol biopolymer transport system component